MEDFGEVIKSPLTMAPAMEHLDPQVKFGQVDTIALAQNAGAVNPHVASEAISTANVTEGAYTLADAAKGSWNNFKANTKERLSHMRFNASKARAVGASAIALAGGIVGFNSVSHESGIPSANADGLTSALANEAPNCKDIDFNNVSANAKNFTPKAFLPKVNGENAQHYIDGLFAEDGALLHDAHSLAAFSAAVEAFKSGKVNDPNYSYTKTYENKLAAYHAEGGEQVAARDCATDYVIAEQIAGDNPSWAQPGDHVSNFEAERDQAYHIKGATLTKPQVVQQKLGGIEFVARDTTKTVDNIRIQGAPEFLILDNGEIVFKGLKPSDSGSTTKQKGHKHQKTNNHDHAAQGNGKGAQKPEQQNGGSGQQSNEQAPAGTSGTSNGTSQASAESNVPGPVPESEQGQLPGPNSGNGGPTGTQEGPLPSPSTGGGGGTPTGGGGGETGTPPSGGPVTSPPSGGGETPPPVQQPPTQQPPVEQPPQQPPTEQPPVQQPPVEQPPQQPPEQSPPVKGTDPGQPGA